MLRAIPLPDETVESMKHEYHDPMASFLLRMRLWELDQFFGNSNDDTLINELEIEQLVITQKWPTC